jgi:ribosomal protein S27AE
VNSGTSPGQTVRHRWSPWSVGKLTRWVRLACPRCGNAFDVLDLPNLIAWCPRCSGRPEMERTAT